MDIDKKNRPTLYCAFLRGVNVNGTSMKMEEVCKVFSEAGMDDVSFVLTTGNILFKSNKNPEILKEILEKALSSHYHYEANLFIRTKEEIAQILDKNPFEASPDKHIYVFIGLEGTDDILMKEFHNSAQSENEKGQICGDVFFWQVLKGDTLNSSFGKILGRKTLRSQMTSRNISTIEKVHKKFLSYS